MVDEPHSKSDYVYEKKITISMLTLLRPTDSHIIQLLDDPFIRLILLRFCLFTAVLQMHTAFKVNIFQNVLHFQFWQRH